MIIECHYLVFSFYVSIIIYNLASLVVHKMDIGYKLQNSDGEYETELIELFPITSTTQSQA